MTLAEQHHRLSQRTRKPFALLYVDVDELKHINNSFGHAQGDQALRVVASTLQRSYREIDILARIGGDEFVALLVDCNLTNARASILRLEELLRLAQAEEENPGPIKLSTGIALFDPANPISLQDLLEQADASMYASKKQRHKGIR